MLRKTQSIHQNGDSLTKWRLGRFNRRAGTTGGRNVVRGSKCRPGAAGQRQEGSKCRPGAAGQIEMSSGGSRTGREMSSGGSRTGREMSSGTAGQSQEGSQCRPGEAGQVEMSSGGSRVENSESSTGTPNPDCKFIFRYIYIYTSMPVSLGKSSQRCNLSCIFCIMHVSSVYLVYNVYISFVSYLYLVYALQGLRHSLHLFGIYCIFLFFRMDFICKLLKIITEGYLKCILFISKL